MRGALIGAVANLLLNLSCHLYIERFLCQNMKKAEEELSEAQRLAMLEDTVSTNRVVLMVIAILAGSGDFGSGVTIAVVKVMQPDVAYADTSFAKLERVMSRF